MKYLIPQPDETNVSDKIIGVMIYHRLQHKEGDLFTPTWDGICGEIEVEEEGGKPKVYAGSDQLEYYRLVGREDYVLAADLPKQHLPAAA